MSESTIRPDVMRFAFAMEKKLSKHDDDCGERGWIDTTYPVTWFISRMDEEMKELMEAAHDIDPEAVKRECADVANFAMMIFTILEERERKEKDDGN